MALASSSTVQSRISKLEEQSSPHRKPSTPGNMASLSPGGPPPSSTTSEASKSRKTRLRQQQWSAQKQQLPTNLRHYKRRQQQQQSEESNMENNSKDEAQNSNEDTDKNNDAAAASAIHNRGGMSKMQRIKRIQKQQRRANQASKHQSQERVTPPPPTTIVPPHSPVVVPPPPPTTTASNLSSRRSGQQTSRIQSSSPHGSLTSHGGSPSLVLSPTASGVGTMGTTASHPSPASTDHGADRSLDPAATDDDATLTSVRRVIHGGSRHKRKGDDAQKIVDLQHPILNDEGEASTSNGESKLMYDLQPRTVASGSKRESNLMLRHGKANKENKMTHSYDGHQQFAEEKSDKSSTRNNVVRTTSSSSEYGHENSGSAGSRLYKAASDSKGGQWRNSLNHRDAKNGGGGDDDSKTLDYGEEDTYGHYQDDESMTSRQSSLRHGISNNTSGNQTQNTNPVKNNSHNRHMWVDSPTARRTFENSKQSTMRGPSLGGSSSFDRQGFSSSGQSISGQQKSQPQYVAMAPNNDPTDPSISGGSGIQPKPFSDSHLINPEEAELYSRLMETNSAKIGLGVVCASTIGCLVLGPAGLLVGAAAIGMGIGYTQLPEDQRQKIESKAKEKWAQFEETAGDVSDQVSSSCATHYQNSAFKDHLDPCFPMDPKPQAQSTQQDIDAQSRVSEAASRNVATANHGSNNSTAHAPPITSRFHHKNHAGTSAASSTDGAGTVSGPPVVELSTEGSKPKQAQVIASVGSTVAAQFVGKKKQGVACLRQTKITPVHEIHRLDPKHQPRAWLEVMANANTSFAEKDEAMEEILILAKDKRRARALLEEGILDSLMWIIGRYQEKRSTAAGIKRHWKNPSITYEEQSSSRRAAQCVMALGKAHCAAIHTEGDLLLMSMYERGTVPEERQVAQMLHEVPFHIRATKTDDPTITDVTSETFTLKQLQLPQAEELARSIKELSDTL